MIEATSFTQSMGLVEVAADLPNPDGASTLFQSTAFPYRPVTAIGAFGGHVCAQSLLAAAETLPSRLMLCHAFQGTFLLPGKTNTPFLYLVSHLRDGKSYSSRLVHVYQDGSVPEDRGIYGGARGKPEKAGEDAGTGIGNGIGSNTTDYRSILKPQNLCFIATVNFKRKDASETLRHEAELPSELSFSALAPQGIEKLPFAYETGLPFDSHWVENMRKVPGFAEFYSRNAYDPRKLLDMRLADTQKYNKGQPPSKRRVVHFFRSNQQDSHMSGNLLIAALLYASDRNSLFTLGLVQDEFPAIRQIASLTHAFIVHDLDLPDLQEWQMLEAWSDKTGDGRGVYNGKIWTDGGKKLLCSFIQDGVLRVGPVADPGGERFLEGVGRKAKL